MHCFRRAASRLQLSNISSSSLNASSLIARPRCSVPSTSMFAATRFAYPSTIQTRLNSTNEGNNKVNVRYIESITPEQREERRRQYLSEGPVPKCSLYIGNLFFDVTAEDLRKHFEQFGVVENVMIVHDARGLSKGFGYINFSTVEEASNAIQQQHGGIYEGREVVVQFANTTYKTTRTESSPSMTLYLGNIPYELTDVDLQEIFEDLQGVKDVRIPVDRRTGLPRGFGHVDFVDQKAATEAKEILARKAPYGRKLIVNYAKRKVLTPENHARHQEKKLEKREAYLKRQAEREAQAAEQAEQEPVQKQEQVQEQESEQVQEPVKEQEQK